MKSRIEKIQPVQSKIIKIKSQDDYNKLDEAAEIIKKGEVVAFPTETVYGLGAGIFREEGLKKIFKVKGRPADNPLIVHIAEREELDDLVEEIPEEAEKLMEKFWPGPLTLILKKSDKISPLISAGLDTVAIRMPEEEIARELIKRSGMPIAAPSANISGRPSITRGEDLVTELSGKVPALVLGSDSKIGIESTVLNLAGKAPQVLRPGYISSEMISRVIGPLGDKDLPDNEKPRSPGMKYKHYSPRAEVILLTGDKDQILEKAQNFEREHPGERTLLIGLDLPEGRDIISFDSVEDYQKEVYALFREADRNGYTTVLAEKPISEDKNLALIDRLEHAANYEEI